MNEHWEDRLTEEQHKVAGEAILKFRKGTIDENDLYHILVDSGCTPEEAQEICDLEHQGRIM